MGYYIYKYVKDNKILYIGQTTDLSRRIKDHEKDKLAGFTGKIYYFECPNKTAMDSWEYCLINKYHPIDNIALKDKNININIEEPKWNLYEIIYPSDEIIYLPKKEVKEVEEVKEVKEFDNFIFNTVENSKYDIKFHCSRCFTDFITNQWIVTKKGFSSDCPCCNYAVWISKNRVANQISYRNIKNWLKNKTA